MGLLCICSKVAEESVRICVYCTLPREYQAHIENVPGRTNMTTHKTPNEIKSEIIEWLKETRYASTYLEALSGGKANFIYRARLSKALEDGTTDVVVKHGEAYMAKFPCNELTIGRCVCN